MVFGAVELRHFDHGAIRKVSSIYLVPTLSGCLYTQRGVGSKKGVAVESVIST